MKQVDMESLIADRRNGMGVAELGVKYDLNPSTVTRRLRAVGMATYNTKNGPAAVRPIGFIARMDTDNPDSFPPQHPQFDPSAIPFTQLPETPAYQQNAYKFGHAPEKTETPEVKLARDYDFHEYYGQFCDYLGFKAGDFSAPEKKVVLDGAEFNVVAGDLHVPYENQDSVKWMIKRTFKKANRLILGGDLADMFYFSKYMKFQQHFSPLEEMVRVQAQIAAFSEAYDEVIIMRGNHDDRYVKWMKRVGIPAEVFKVFEYLHGKHALHPIYVLAQAFKNVKVVESIDVEYASFSYFYQHGDAVISHAEKYSKIPNKAASDVIQSFKSFHEARGIVKPFKVLIQCHTHQAGKTWNDFGCVGIENGCLAQLPDYSGGSKFLPHRSPVLGFTELHQVNGVSDLEKTNFIPYMG